MVPRTIAASAARRSGRCLRKIQQLLPHPQNRGLHPGSHGSARQPGLSSVGFDDSFPMDEKMANSNDAPGRTRASDGGGTGLYVALVVLLFTGAVYIGCMVSPPSLMDDVDAVQAQIARNMLTSGDWVTARLDGVIYLEKAPLIYWMMAICYRIFGAYDWVARIPVVLGAMALAWLTAAFGTWAFGKRAGLFAGLSIGTCIGLFLFTRIQIPDVILAADIALSMWAFLRILDDEEPNPR